MLKLPSRLTFDQEWNFWLKIDRKSETECWNWTGAVRDKTPTARPCFGLNGSTYYASRISFWLANKIDPGEALVLHTCNNELCLNPSHLYLGTSSQNAYDRYKDGCKPNKNNAKINDEIAAEIRYVAQVTNLSHKEIGIKFGLAHQTVSQILRQETWR